MASSTILSDNGASSGSAGLKSTAGNDGKLILQTATSGGTATDALAIDTSQNVGIGTTSPDAKLVISGYTGTGYNTAFNYGTQHNFIVQGTSGYTMFRKADGTELMRINQGAPILCLAGGNTSATGTGIAFPATQSASSDANTLDDYEEGTFTAYVSDGTNSVSLGTSNYIKVGAKVTVWIDAGYAVNVSSLSATSTQLRITGLPFTTAKSSHVAAIIYYNNSGLNYFFGVPASGTAMYFEQANNVVDANATTRALLGTPGTMTVFATHTYWAS